MCYKEESYYKKEQVWSQAQESHIKGRDRDKSINRLIKGSNKFISFKGKSNVNE